MLSKILSLSKKLISIKSIPEQPKQLERILEIALKELNSYKIERFEKKGTKSALVYNSKSKPKRFKIILNAHLDVIPGKEHQYKPQVKGNKLFGAGALDMKANASCLILVFRELARKVNYPLGLQLVTDEEVGGFNGTKYQVDRGIRADFVIAGETTNFNIVNCAKGILWLKISSKGKTAHGAYPWRGQNAIWKMNTFLNLFAKKYPLPNKDEWKTTVNLSRIETSNNSFNKIPDDCSILLDIRYVPEDKDIVTPSIRKILPKGFKMDVLLNEPSLSVKSSNEHLKLLQNVCRKATGRKVTLYGANGSSDARHFSRVNCDGVEFGPVGGGIGSDNEWIDIKSLEKYYKVLKDFLLSI